MPDSEIYNKILNLPLLLGMNSNDFGQVVSSVKFGFHHFMPGKQIKKEGDACDHIIFLVDGAITSITGANNHSYTVSERINAPAMLQPERIFGLTQHYTKSYISATECHLISLDKNEVRFLLESFEVFRLNLLNIIATQSQRQEKAKWREASADIEERIMRFLHEHITTAHGEAFFKIKMTTLANEIGHSRLDTSKALHKLEDRKLIRISRGMITVLGSGI
jgi:CRP-like cAMP-binding protein